MSHYVVCTKCGVRFDRDVIQAVKDGGRRYAHYTCKPDGELVPLPQKDPDLTALEEYIDKLLGKEANKARINKQIKEYTLEKGYSYSGILKSLIYFFEVKGNSIDKANGGIGIVPFVYQDAYNYYYDLFLAKSRNETKDVSIITSKVREVTIKPPERPVQKRFFNFLDEGEDNE
jgi:hypothetical protein